MALSYPKNKIKALLLENLHPDAKSIFSNEGYQVETLKGALDEDELIEKIKDVHVLGIRSKTNVTRKVLEHPNASKLMSIGAFCIGTNQIDLEAASENGIVAFNAPYSNTRSVVELAIGEIVMLLRGITPKSAKMHQGIWNKSATNSFEVRGKKIGIIGYGNIGMQLSIIAEAMGMQVFFYDIVDKLALGNAQKCSTLNELLGKVDVVSLHVDGRPNNKDIFGKKQFDAMKKGSYFLNLSRGIVVDLKELAANMKSGKILGAGVDVFPKEPKTNAESFESELLGIENLILTPHIGGSTAEAQEHIGGYVPQKMISYVNTGSTYGSVNYPNLQLDGVGESHRIIHIHKNVPGILAQINKILAHHGCNISGQHLKTVGGIGYAIFDMDSNHDDTIIEELKSIPETIKARILY